MAEAPMTDPLASEQHVGQRLTGSTREVPDPFGQRPLKAADLARLLVNAFPCVGIYFDLNHSKGGLNTCWA
jgi:hypothetical protein